MVRAHGFDGGRKAVIGRCRRCVNPKPAQVLDDLGAGAPETNVWSVTPKKVFPCLPSRPGQSSIGRGIVDLAGVAKT
jgi:hypothetical protein